MEIKSYCKAVIPEVLQDMFMLNTAIWPKIAYINSDPFTSEGHDNIKIAFKEVPSSAELDIVADIINGYDGHLLVTRYGIEKELCNPAMAFGREMIAKIGANNLALNKSAEEVNHMMENSHVIHSLLTGSINTAYATFSQYEATINGGGIVEGFTLSEVIEFRRRCGLYIGVEA